MRIRVKQEWKAESITQPAHVARIIRAVLETEDEFDRAKEHIWVIGLNQKHAVQYIDLVHLGTADTCQAHPREIYRRAVVKGCSAIILVHNHPSGVPTPGEDDRALTDRIAKAGQVLGIRLIDHVIVGIEGQTSFQELGLL